MARELRSVKADAKQRGTERMLKNEKQLQCDLEEAKAEVGRLQNQTRDTSDRLAYTHKRIKQLEKAQEREVGRCLAAVTTIQEAENDREAARKDHRRLATEIADLQVQADELRPPPKPPT